MLKWERNIRNMECTLNQPPWPHSVSKDSISIFFLILFKVNFYFLSWHTTKFEISAEWHFFATAHGKGAVDGLGGATKRYLRLEALKGKIITNAKEAYEAMKSRNSDVFPILLTEEEINKVKIPQTLKPITGTQSFHAALEVKGPKSLVFKETSNSYVKLNYSF